MSVEKVNIVSVSEDDLNKIFSAIGMGSGEYTNRSFYQHVGFTSKPKPDTIGLVLKSGDNYTMIASTDSKTDRPELSNDKDVAIYSDADKYVKINAGGDIEISNNNNTITLKANGGIELGTGILSKIIKETIITKYNTHTHVSASPGSPTAVPSVLFTSSDATTTVEAE